MSRSARKKPSENIRYDGCFFERSVTG